MLFTTALAGPGDLSTLPPPDRQRLGSYHSDPLFAPHLDISALGGVTQEGDGTAFALIELRLGGTFAFGVGASDDLLQEGPTLTWAWRAVSYRHLWCLDLVLRTPLSDFEDFSAGLGGDFSPRPDGRIAARVRALVGFDGFSGELGVVFRAF